MFYSILELEILIFNLIEQMAQKLILSKILRVHKQNKQKYTHLGIELTKYL